MNTFVRLSPNKILEVEPLREWVRSYDDTGNVDVMARPFGEKTILGGAFDAEAEALWRFLENYVMPPEVRTESKVIPSPAERTCPETDQPWTTHFAGYNTRALPDDDLIEATDADDNFEPMSAVTDLVRDWNLPEEAVK